MFLFLLINTIFIIGCNKKNSQSSETISRRKFIRILIDIHKTDAFLGIENLNDNFFLDHADSLSYYNSIFKKYNVTVQEFYNTVEYYVKNMDKFLEIEKVVVDSLKNQYANLDSMSRIEFKSNDIWNLKRFWSLPEDGTINPIYFKILTDKSGTYTLEATFFQYPDDLSEDLSMKLFVSYQEDSTKSSKILNIHLKKKVWQKFSVSIVTNSNRTLQYIEGYLLWHSAGTSYMHLKVKDISLFLEQKDTTSVDSLNRKLIE